MRYLSVFTGIAGLEHSSIKPVLACEQDSVCRTVLERRMPGVPLHPDAETLDPPKVDLVVGGWPCQDLTSAGKMSGLNGSRSGLFFKMVDVAVRAQAHTIIGENVPNLLYMNDGREFEVVLTTLADAGYKFVSWRTLNAREFGLPQERRRVFIVASRDPEVARSLHRAALPSVHDPALEHPRAAGFYWTAGGGRSICYSRGFVPTLKVGASDSKGRSAVAIFHAGKVRKLSAAECLAIQGFAPEDFEGISKTDCVRMAGNAVPAPVGRFVVDTVAAGVEGTAPLRTGVGIQTGFARITAHGFFDGSITWSVDHAEGPLATHLESFLLSDDEESLSAQAAAGLLYRSAQGKKDLPLELFDALIELSRDRSGKLHPSRANSFEKLDEHVDLVEYRMHIERSRPLREASPLYAE